jgi:hypothetical protein
VEPGETHSTAEFAIDSATATLRGRAHAEAQEKASGGGSADSLMRLGVRQYYRAEGDNPLTVTLNFHYEGSWELDSSGQSYNSVKTGTYVSKILDQESYFNTFAEGLELNGFEDFSTDNFYDDFFGADQEIAETLSYFLHSSTPSTNDSWDGDDTTTFTVNPGELITVDTMLNLHVSASLISESPTDPEPETYATIDYMDTAYSSVVVTGEGSLIPENMPIVIPEPKTIWLLMLIGPIALLKRRRAY